MKDKLQVTYIQHIGDDLGVVNAARISHFKEVNELKAGDEKLIHYLADHEHMTPFEHNTLTVRVSCPLFIRSQIHRHRTFSYNEVSRRYTSEGIEFYFFPEDDVRIQSKTNKQGSDGILSPAKAEWFCAELLKWTLEGKAKYEYWVEQGVAREQARVFLPVNLITHFYMTANLRNWMGFLKLRLHEHAQKELRIVSGDVAEIIQQYWPVSFKALSKNWSFEYVKEFYEGKDK